MEHEGQKDLKSTKWIKGKKRDRKKEPDLGKKFFSYLKRPPSLLFLQGKAAEA
jgi:hypothetical protein